MSMLRVYQRDPSRTCPYFIKGGKCRSGCWSEPFCVTGQPSAGWHWYNLLLRARRVGSTPGWWRVER